MDPVSSNFTANVSMHPSGNLTWSNETAGPPGRGSSALKVASDVVITMTLVVIMLGMGCTIEIKNLVHHLKKPIGATIGMIAQFIILPLATFGFAHALQLEPLAAIGMLVMGCCPGGSTSNMFTYWVDGDVPLSLTMTTLSTVLALGMMPFNIWMYSRSWINETLTIPYVNIITSLVMTVVPAATGTFIRWRFTKIADFILKIGSYVGILAVILTMTLVSVLYPFMYQSSWKIYVGSFFLPFVGFAFGYLVALIFRQDHIRCRTIALETGIQNFPLSMTLISLSFPQHMIPKIGLFPLLYGVFVLSNSCLFVLGYKVIIMFQKRTASEQDKFISVPTQEMEQADIVKNGPSETHLTVS
ncbi:hypothetical protein ACJMK2_043147 [Sinanodonta woodiana]|uniref:Ileal sodium/bile acid cotransporter n=1 Tax=Sinanodonta woodiana TaxID=1069815 RepID=A0ABD3VYW3_SINWO